MRIDFDALTNDDPDDDAFIDGEIERVQEFIIEVAKLADKGDYSGATLLTATAQLYVGFAVGCHPKFKTLKNDERMHQLRVELAKFVMSRLAEISAEDDRRARSN